MVKRVILVLAFAGTLYAQSPRDAMRLVWNNFGSSDRDTSKFIQSTYDWNEITRRAFEVNWVNFSSAWQRRFQEAIQATVTDRVYRHLRGLKGNHAQVVRWGDEEIGDSRARIKVEFLADGDWQSAEMDVSFTDGNWKIYDLRTTNAKLSSIFEGLDDLVSTGFGNEYIEALILSRDEFVIDEIVPGESGQFPRGWGWRKKDDSRIREKKTYSVQTQSDNFYIQAQSSKEGVPLVKPVSFNLKDYPVLSWKWRIEDSLTAGMSASVSVIYYQNWIGYPITIRYVWSTEGSPCSVIKESGLFYDSHVIVLRNASDSVGVWLPERVNLRDDYQRIFGEDPPEATAGISIRVDSQRGKLRVDYDNFMCRKNNSSLSCKK